MEAVKDNSELPEDYWNNYGESTDFDERFGTSFNSKKLVNGINIKDLCDGKEIMFEVSQEDEGEDSENEDKLSDEIVFCDPKSMREKRGAPPLGCSFEEIARGMINVTENGFVKKQVITSGIGKPVPDLAYVTVHYNLYKKTCELPFDSSYLRNRPEKFRLDQGEVIPGLEHAIKSMRKNENSMFYIKWEVAFGALGCPDRIEERCDIVADVTLLNFVEIDSESDLTRTEISKIDFSGFINQVKRLLCNGSDDFSKGDVRNAVFSYRKALRILNNLRLANEEEESEMLKQKLKCLVNLAVCYNKLGKPEQACVVCQEALSIDHNHLKANFHYGRANVALSNFSVAERCLLKADKLKPNDRDINKEIKKLSDKKALYAMQNKMFWKKAFEGDEKEDGKEEESAVLESFEKNLKISLEECLKEKKSHVISTPLPEKKMEICYRIANEMNFEVEKNSQLCILKCPSDRENILPRRFPSTAAARAIPGRKSNRAKFSVT